MSKPGVLTRSMVRFEQHLHNNPLQPHPSSLKMAFKKTPPVRMNIERTFTPDSVFYLYKTTDITSNTFMNRIACAVIRNNKLVEVFPRQSVSFPSLEEWVHNWPATNCVVRDGFFWGKKMEVIPMSMFRQKLE